jgi:hypothetical protein
VILWDDFSARVDWPQAVRGASRGFTVLLIGALLGPLLATVPVIGPPWLLIATAAGFVVAAWRTGDALTPAVHGATAAVLSFLLVLPMLLFLGSRLGFAQLGTYVSTGLVMAVAVGALTGWVRTRGS